MRFLSPVFACSSSCIVQRYGVLRTGRVLAQGARAGWLWSFIPCLALSPRNGWALLVPCILHQTTKDHGR